MAKMILRTKAYQVPGDSRVLGIVLGGTFWTFYEPTEECELAQEMEVRVTIEVLGPSAPEVPDEEY